jgi:hypothetical protein
MHLPLQATLGATQLQAPFTHFSPGAHDVPHCPQCCASLFVSAQLEPHFSQPVGQAQVPLEQYPLVGHLLKQDPQWLGLVCSVAHEVPHWV